MIEVELSYAELIIAGNAGVLRYVNALKHRRQQQDAAHNDNLQGHVNGCIAEWAVARWLDVNWQPWVTFEQLDQIPGDVANIEVRSTFRPNGRMIMHDYSRDERPYLFVRTHRAPVLEFHGWLYGHEAKRPEWWEADAPRPAYFVAPRDLHPVETLPRP